MTKNRGQRIGAVSVVVALTVGLLAPAGGAQEIGEPEPESPDRLERVGRFELPAELDGLNIADLWVWPEERLGYLVTGDFYRDQSNTVQLPQRDQFGLVAIDLDTFEPVARTGCRNYPQGLTSTQMSVNRCVEPKEDVAFPYWIHRGLFQGRFGGMAVDREGGRLFVAHHNAIGFGDSGGAFSGDLLGGVNVDPHTENQARCHNVGAPGRGHAQPCFAGVYVLDARTLEVTADLPFLQVGLDGAGAQWNLLTMSHTPHPGAEGKVHVLLEDQLTIAQSQQDEQTGQDVRTRSNQQYAAQIDVASGRTDWVEPVRGCTGATTFHLTQTEGWRGAIFRSPDPARPVVWVGCWASGDRVAGIVRLDLDTGEQAVAGQRGFAAPGWTIGFRQDPAVERIFVKAAAPGETLWWVFDGREGGFVARAGIGSISNNQSADAFDPDSGRLYTLARHDRPEDGNVKRGAGWVDAHRTQLPQYTWDPAALDGAPNHSWRLAVDPGDGERLPRLFVRRGTQVTVFEDAVPVSTDPAPEEVQRSDDVSEREGATTATFGGSARGYGARTIFLRGVGGLVGYDSTGSSSSTSTSNLWHVDSGCTRRDRALAVGLAGSPERSELATLDSLGTAVATAQAIYADSTTEGDVEQPYSRCRETRMPEWDELRTGFVRGLPDEPGASDAPGRDPDASPVPGTARATCAAPERTSEDTADPIVPGLTAEVACDDGVVSAASRARAAALGPVDVAEAGSTFRVHRRDDGGVDARVESWARGVTIAGEQGTVTIDLIRAVGTAWATGRAQPEGVGDQPDDPDDSNCDETRTAGTCYVRSFSGAQVLDADGATLFSCDPCADRENQERLVAGMQSALGASWIVSLPQPDPDWAPGAADGAQAALLKRATTQFADATLKGDLLPTMPALELLRVNDTVDASIFLNGGTGRQTYQFAGVEADVTYGISCLLTIVDGECVGEPASLDIELTDLLGVPLPGGAFEVHAAGEDGMLDLEASLGDTLVCVTGPDGSCGFDEVAPGTYVVQQVAAPDGYVPMEDQTIDLPAGGHGTLSVVNGTLPVTGIAITLTDLDGDALEGGEFELHAGETVADGAPALATCTTDETGVCRFPAPALPDVEVPLPLDLLPVALPDPPEGLLQVPGGDYTVRQASAPEGYEPVDDIGFELPDGEIARVTLSNAPPWLDDFVEGDAVAAFDTDTGVTEPVSFAPPPPVAEPAFHVEFPAQPDLAVAAPAEADESLGRQMMMLPGDVAAFALRHPKEALAFGGVLLLFAAAAAAAYRRRFVLELLGP